MTRNTLGIGLAGATAVMLFGYLGLPAAATTSAPFRCA